MKVLRAELAVTAASPKAFPTDGRPEIAFLGRSNVGKSSLLNRLAQRRRLAHTSRTPGKTRLVHFYGVDLRFESGDEPPSDSPTRQEQVLLVDLPGYGYAKVPKAERIAWQRLVEGYLEDRPVLRVAALLHDIRRDPSDDEQLLLAWLDERRIPALVVLTKADKLAPMQRARRVRELCRVFAQPADRVITTSAERGLGVSELWRALAGFLGKAPR
ncbi:MAG TPA: ribosome biogenesis GTP-binding protein YihA/YsxC [Myxococcota bacterium]|nr:ribosome biogenesis GTP-binding protein YihA/YsxC [Myxococcota bacterium]